MDKFILLDVLFLYRKTTSWYDTCIMSKNIVYTITFRWIASPLTDTLDTIFKGGHLRTIMPSLVPSSTVDSEEKIYFSYVQLNCAVIAFLDDGRQIQILKGTTLGLLWPRLLSFGPVVSEEEICICKKMGLPRTQQDTTAAIYSSWYTLSLQN